MTFDKRVGDEVRVKYNGEKYGPYRIWSVAVLPATFDVNAQVSRVTVETPAGKRTVPVGAIC